MDRARRAGLTALIVVVLLAASGGPAGIPVLAATVEWPVSSLVVSEVQTGGASASDEFVEIANQGSTVVDLAGLELVYATASGSTVTRKAMWDEATVLAPGRRLLLANAAGSLIAGADAAYSGGFAATGGALALRVIGGAVVDSVGWGDATSGFVEGAAGSAPPAGSSLERRPGGLDGNTIDTNDNASDWFVQGSPSPQGSASPPVPTPGSTATPSPTGTPGPTPTAGPTPTPAPTPSPTPVPTPTPTPVPAPTPTPTPTPVPTPSPSPSPTATPSPSPTSAPISIAGARALPDGTTVTVEGVLTTDLGSLESGRGGFVQDGSGGIAVYLDAPAAGSWPAGTTVVLRGAISNRFSQRTLRLAEAVIQRGPVAGIPAAIALATGDAAEAYEGSRISLSGTIIGSPGTLADGIGISLDDGSGAIRVVIGNGALAGQALASGMTATIAGPLGQRDSSGTGSAGYRVHATLDGELVVAELTPTPDPSPTPDPDDTQSPDPTTEPTASPSGSPGTGGVQSLATVRTMAPGTRVTVTAVVIGEEGRLATPAVIAVGDDGAGLAVRLPRGTGPFARGTLLQVSGTLADPYGQLEIRAATDGVRALGTGAVPIAIAAGTLDETVEGRLVTVTGTLAAKPSRSSGGDVTLVLERAGAASVKVVADASSQIGVSAFAVGATYRVTGIVGQRASRKGALDGYRLHPRDPGDLVALPGSGEPSPSAGPGGSPGATGSPGPSSVAVVRIATALGRIDQLVAIEGTVTAPPTLLDSTGRRIVVQDSSAAIELLLPGGVDAPAVGARIRAEGVVGRAYGAPRLRAEGLTSLGTGSLPAPLVLRRAPGLAQEWRLVTVTGRIDDLRRLGDRWRAELLVAGSKVVVVGQPGAGIPAAALAEGRMATVTGIVRRPYPTASDQRYAVLPRTRADLRVRGSTATGRPSIATGPGRSTDPGRSTGPGRSAGAAGAPGGDGASLAPQTVDADLIDLAAVVGQVVRVGGLIVDLRSDGVLLDDGTTDGLVVLRGPALELLPLLEPDDAINAIGRVEQLPDGPAVVAVDQPGGIVQAGEPVAPVTTGPGNDPNELGAAGTSRPAGPGQPAEPGREAGLLDGSTGFGAGSSGLGAGFAGLGTLVVVSLASLAVTVARRVAARRRIDRRIAARLAAFAASAGPSPGSRSAEGGIDTLG